MAKKSTVHAPLTPAVLHILLALSTVERHGYGIMKQVEEDSQGRVKMGPGTLYGSIGRMTEAALIRESGKRVDPEMDDERRIYYELTNAGRAALEAELKRYRGVVAVAEGRLAHDHEPSGYTSTSRRPALPERLCDVAATVSTGLS